MSDLATPACAEVTSAHILVVDDQEQNIELLRRVLQRGGYTNVRGTTAPEEVLERSARDELDLVVLDLHMPRMDGFTLMRRIRVARPAPEFLPILCLTADFGADARERALSSGATDFITKPFDTVEVLLRVRNLLETRMLYRELAQQKAQLEVRIAERTRALEAAHAETLERLAQAAELRDDDTGQHTRRVGEMAAAIARQMGLDEAEVELIRRAAPLHDVGKIGIPDSVLLKPGALSHEEREMMCSHTLISSRILANARSPLMARAEQIARSHHERWDGTGYPDGLSGEQIPLAARIVAVADVFDALAHDRVYRPAWPLERVRGEVTAQAGKHFDPDVVEAFLRVLDEAGDRPGFPLTPGPLPRSTT